MAHLYGKRRNLGIWEPMKNLGCIPLQQTLSGPHQYPLNYSSTFLWCRLEASKILHLRAFFWPQWGASYNVGVLVSREQPSTDDGRTLKRGSQILHPSWSTTLKCVLSPRAPCRTELPLGLWGSYSIMQCISYPLLRNRWSQNAVA